MAIKGEITQTYGSFEFGIDDTAPPGSKITEGTLYEALNTDLLYNSLCSKRKGYGKINTSAWSTRRFRQGFEYAKADGTKEDLVYAEASTPTGSSGIFGKLNGTSAPTTITSGLVDDVKPSIVQYSSRVFVFNGSSDFLYDGTSTRQIGITAPSVAPTYNSLIDGSLNESATYFFGYTYFNSVTGAESSLSPLSAIITTSTDPQDGIRINITPGSATTADTINIYRTVAGGSILFFEGSTGISSTTYDSVIADSGLGDQVEQDNDRLPEAARYATLNYNRIFVAGFSSNPNRIQYSKVGQFGSMPESFQALDFVDCNINDGDRIVGLGVVNGIVIVLKQRSIGRLIPISTPTGFVEQQGSQKYIYQELSKEVTCLGHHVFSSFDTNGIFLGVDDIYWTDGNKVQRLGGRILTTYQTLNFSKSYKWSCVNKIDTQQVIFSVCRAGQSEPDFQLVGHYKKPGTVAWTYYSPGTNTTTHPGLRAGCLWSSTTSGNTRRYLFGSSDAVGYVYQLGVGDSDSTNGIYWKISLPWDYVSAPDRLKLFHTYTATVLGEGDYTVTNFFNKDNITVSSLTNNINVAQILGVDWNASTWGSFNWASTAISPIIFKPHDKAHFGQYGLFNSGADQPIDVKSISKVVTPTFTHR